MQKIIITKKIRNIIILIITIFCIVFSPIIINKLSLILYHKYEYVVELRNAPRTNYTIDIPLPEFKSKPASIIEQKSDEQISIINSEKGYALQISGNSNRTIKNNGYNMINNYPWWRLSMACDKNGNLMTDNNPSSFNWINVLNIGNNTIHIDIRIIIENSNEMHTQYISSDIKSSGWHIVECMNEYVSS